MPEELETTNDQTMNDTPGDIKPKPRNTRQWVAFFAILTLCCWGAVGASLLSAGVMVVPPIVTARQATQVQAVTQTQLALVTPHSTEIANTPVPSSVATEAGPQIPSLTPTQTLLPTETLVPTTNWDEVQKWPILLTETFTNNDNNWTTVDVQRPDDKITIEIVEDKYHWEIEAPDGFWLPVGFELGPVRDFYASVDTAAIIDSDYFYYGIIFRANSGRGFYYFALTQTGEPFFGLYYDNRWTRSVTFEPVLDLIKPDTNRLGVIAEGPYFTFMLNGQPVAEIEDDRLPYGELGLALGQETGDESVVFDFDNFEILMPQLDMAHVPTATAAAALVQNYLQGQVSYNDGFSANNYDWYVGKDDSLYGEGQVSIKDGKYRWSYEAYEGFVQLFIPNVPRQADFYYTAEVQKTGGTEDALYGIVIRRHDNDNYYFFGINDQQETFVYLLYNGEWETIIAYSNIAAIRPGEVNVMSVLAEDTYIAFFINGQYIGDLENARLLEGNVGVAINLHATGDDIEVEFDNLEVHTLVGDSDSAQPTPSIRPTQYITTTPFAVLMPFEVSGQIVYQLSGRLEIMNADGSNKRRLDYSYENAELFRDVYAPQFSSDGKRIIFEQTGKLYVVEAPDFRLKPLEIAGDELSYPTWSPSSNQIAYTSLGNLSKPQSDIYILTFEDDSIRQLTTSPQIETDLDWSPNGKDIVFVEIDKGNYTIKIIETDGSNLRSLTDGLAKDRDPAWSPDGQWIAFTSNRDGNNEIYIIRPDGSDLTRLINDTANDFGPTWSPDGQYVAFVSDRDGTGEVYITKVDGSAKVVRITLNTLAENDLDWGP